MPGVGLQLLPMTAAESSPWDSCPFPQPWSATLAAAEGKTSCFAFGRSPCQLGMGCLVLWSSGSVRPCASQGLSRLAENYPRGLMPVQMTSVERACWYAADASVSYALLGWAGGLGSFAARENQALATRTGDGQSAHQEWIWTSDRDCPRRRPCIFSCNRQTHTYKGTSTCWVPPAHRPIAIAITITAWNDLQIPSPLPSSYSLRRHNLLGRLSRPVSNIVASRHNSS